MKIFIDNIVCHITLVLANYGPLSGVCLVFLESIFPVLPLGVFIALNITTFGLIRGFITSWVATLLGSFLLFIVFKNFFKERQGKYKLELIERFRKITFPQLVLLISLPFIPSFLVNVISGIANITYKRYFLALSLGKVVIIFFWGIIGKSLLECLTNVKVLVVIVVVILIFYKISKVIANKYGI